MVVAAARVVLHLEASHSLKQKRGVLNAIRSRLKNRFNLAVAEVEGQDTWQRAVLGLCTVALSAQDARRRLERAVDFIEGLHLAEVRAQEIEIL